MATLKEVLDGMKPLKVKDLEGIPLTADNDMVERRLISRSSGIPMAKISQYNRPVIIALSERLDEFLNVGDGSPEALFDGSHKHVLSSPLNGRTTITMRPMIGSDTQQTPSMYMDIARVLGRYGDMTPGEIAEMDLGDAVACVVSCLFRVGDDYELDVG